jgi:alanyl-tRNA synthetase
MTDKLYYKDSKLISFNSEILEIKKFNEQILVQLDKTAFYPTSGGQPFDTGFINDIPVIDVWEDDNIIWHLLDSAPETKNVECKINWSRRFDHMQQHTGQHLLSTVFLDLLGTNTVSFHMGEKMSTIDLDIDNLTREGIHSVEEKVNLNIWENHPIKINVIQDNEIYSIPFRKPPQVTGRIRVILIGDLDASACGGTHVNSTGEIGLIKITGTERYKGGVRVHFLCGSRAFHDYQNVQAIVQKVSKGLSIHQKDLHEAIERLQAESTKHLNAYTNIKIELLTYIAKHLWNESTPIHGIKGVFAHMEDYSSEDLREITSWLKKQPKTCALLATTEGEYIRLICSKSSDLSEYNSNLILTQALDILGGRGGGSPELAQGGAPLTDHQTVLNALEKTMKSIIK